MARVLMGILFISCTLPIIAQEKGTISITTAKRVGETVKLYISSNDNVSFQGLSGEFKNDEIGTYTINSQTFSITGEITILDCKNNKIREIDISDNPLLLSLDCSQNLISKIELYNNPSLVEFYCQNNSISGAEMVELVKNLPDRSEDSDPGKLYVRSDKDDRNKCSKVCVEMAKKKGWIPQQWNSSKETWEIFRGDAPFVSFTTEKRIGEKISLLIVAKGTVNIEGLVGTFENGKEVTYRLTDQTITITGDVSSIDIRKQSLIAIDISNNPNLTTLNCSNNKIERLNVSNNPELKTLDCSDNNITLLTLGENAKLETISCYLNNIKGSNMTNLALSLPNRTKMQKKGEIQAVSPDNTKEGNIFSRRDAEIATEKGWIPQALKKENNTWNPYEGAYVVSKIRMKTNKPIGETIVLQMHINGDLEVKGLKKLPEKGENTYQITDSNIELTGEISKLFCYSLALTNLDVSDNLYLTELYCYDNLLTELNFPRGAKLKRLLCYMNNIKGSKMTDLIKSLPDRGSKKDPGGLYIYNTSANNEQNVCSLEDVALAHDRNWFTYMWDPIVEVWDPYPGEEVANEEIFHSEVRIYPNPAKDIVYIEGTPEARQLFLFSMEGKIVATAKSAFDGKVQIETASLPRGIYILSIGKESYKLLLN